MTGVQTCALPIYGEPVNILVNLSGRGDKDMEYVQNVLGDLLFEDPVAVPTRGLRISEILKMMTAESNAREAGRAVAHH